MTAAANCIRFASMLFPHIHRVYAPLLAIAVALAVPACATTSPATAETQAATAPKGPPQKLSPEDMKEARKNAQVVAGTWLLVVDKGDFLLSWDTGARQLQDVVPASDWTAGLGKAREPFGEMQRRVFIKTKYSNKLNPPGHYVLVKYHSQFAGSAAMETVTVVKDIDNLWRVVMYAIEKTKTPPPAEELPPEAQPADTQEDAADTQPAI